MANQCNRTNIVENTCSIKEEFKCETCTDNKVFITETNINTSSTEFIDYARQDQIEHVELSSTLNNIKIELSSVAGSNIINGVEINNEMIMKTEFSSEVGYGRHTKNDDIKIEDEISAVHDIKIEIVDGLLFCEHCQAYYKDYCIECGMLVHILNKITPSNLDNIAYAEIPKHILEIGGRLEKLGIYALKVIPEGVKFGHFTGLNSSECGWKLKGGRIVVSEEKLKFLGWMQYINSASNISEPNLLAFQCQDKLYYRSIRRIQEGEELLVYFGEEYEDICNNDVKIDFIPTEEGEAKEVFACTFCCLGFSSSVYLIRHKKICLNQTDGMFSIKEIIQCPFCKIYLDEKEYLEHHMSYCQEINDRKRDPLILDNQKVEVNGWKSQKRQMYKCTQCQYRTKYNGNLKNHADKHREISSRRLKTKENLNLGLHVESTHSSLDKEELRKTRIKAGHSQDLTKRFKCSICEFRAKHKKSLDTHIKTKHRQEFKYKCASCGYRSNSKSTFIVHMKSKNMKKFDRECELCQYKTNNKSHLAIHMKSKHLKEFDYKCETCQYRTNYKHVLERHMKLKHLIENDYRCGTCDYKTNQKRNLENHTKTKHLNEFDYKCDICGYGTCKKTNLEIHIKTKHLKEFNYKCDSCEFRTNLKDHLESHIKTKHLLEFDYKCDLCDYKTNNKLNLKMHVKVKHLKQYDFKCALCEHRTNSKFQLKTHMKTNHLKDLVYRCGTCDYKANVKRSLEVHIRTKHLKEFKYKCASCSYETNLKPSLTMHIKTKHLKEFNHKCDMCDYQTNNSHNLNIHIKTIHLQEFDYACAVCPYETNYKRHFEGHVEKEHHK